MSELAVGHLVPSRPGYLAPTCRADGDAWSTLFLPDSDRPWVVGAALEAETELAWGEDHGDEAVYVKSGELRAGDRPCGAEGAIIVERGVATALTVVRPTMLLHFGGAADASSDGADKSGCGIHIVPSGETRTSDGRTEGCYFSSGPCATCSIRLFTRSKIGPHVAASHYHTQDEIIHLLEGELQLGPQVLSAGMSVFIPRDRRYGFRSLGGYRFMNYRGGDSLTVFAPGSEPIVEENSKPAGTVRIAEQP